MVTSRARFTLSSPKGDEAIASSAFGYLRGRHKSKLFDLLVEEFEKSGISQSTLASRMRKDPATISRWLGAPCNLEGDTVSDLLWAISGATISEYVISYPTADHSVKLKTTSMPSEVGCVSVSPGFMVIGHPQKSAEPRNQNTHIQNNSIIGKPKIDVLAA